MKKFLMVSWLISLFVPFIAMASIGVGVATGKIYMEDHLNPGGIYDIQPPVTVLNTGDEPSDYEMSIAFHQDQPEMRPKAAWFSFEPERFYLAPGEAQPVQVTLTVPVKTKPGDYFAFLEARPAKKTTGEGGAQIGVAAATKFWFTVAPSNIFEGAYYRIMALLRNTAPWSYVVLAVVVMAILLTIVKKKFSFSFKVDKKVDKQKDKEEDKKVELEE